MAANKEKFVLMKKFDLLNSSDKFDYQFLGRLQVDCEYYLGYGRRNPKWLWAGNEKDHIALMKEVYTYLSEKFVRPEWITWDDIVEYGKKMCAEVEA